MMNLSCEYCEKEGTLEEQIYSGKRLRLKCPYCSGNFIFSVPGQGAVASGKPVGAAVDTAEPRTAALEAAMTSAPPQPLTAAEPAETTADIDPSMAVPEVDEALVHEAKRISRLIISEIKLYNQEKITRAKSKREVLELLKHDLIKGKQHYNTRIASKLPSGPDYFMETVKEILLAGKS